MPDLLDGIGTAIRVSGNQLYIDSALTEASLTLAELNGIVTDATLVDEGHTHTESDITDLKSYLLATDIDTLAELNAILTDATLVDVTHTHTEVDITDLDKYTQAQVDLKDSQVDANAIAYAIALG